MTNYRVTRLLVPTALLVLPLTYVTSRAAAEEPAPQSSVSVDAEYETMLRGPLHEAFAEPLSLNPAAGIVVPKEPPEPIEEIPPEVKPDDDTALWIPGYWAWDDEREDFLWISGVWRVPPSERRWVPGYWLEVEGGFQWISGLWAAIDADQVEYLPSPPESLERGPTSPQPSTNHYWVSGCWTRHGGRYAWRPGYWGVHQAGWVWVPAHYVWTPRGVIYVDGYWDRPVASRGVVFAPVYFRRPAYARSGYQYSPSVVVNAAGLLLHLFVQPRHHHYYWGDYYADDYRQRGFVAWVDFHGHRGYDPLFTYYEADYRQRDIDYERRMRGWNEHYREHEDRRPAHTYQAQSALAERAEQDPELRMSLLGNQISVVLSNDDGRFRRLDEQQRHTHARSANELNGLTQERAKVEARKGQGRENTASPQLEIRLELPESRLFDALVGPRQPDKPLPNSRSEQTRPNVPSGGGNAAKPKPLLPTIPIPRIKFP